MKQNIKEEINRVKSLMGRTCGNFKSKNIIEEASEKLSPQDGAKLLANMIGEDKLLNANVYSLSSKDEDACTIVGKRMKFQAKPNQSSLSGVYSSRVFIYLQRVYRKMQSTNGSIVTEVEDEFGNDIDDRYDIKSGEEFYGDERGHESLFDAITLYLSGNFYKTMITMTKDFLQGGHIDGISPSEQRDLFNQLMGKARSMASKYLNRYSDKYPQETISRAFEDAALRFIEEGVFNNEEFYQADSNEHL